MSAKQKGGWYVRNPSLSVKPFSGFMKHDADTTPYLLRDEEGEKKLNFNLGKCLARARENGKTLLKGHFFYLVFTTEAAENVIRTLSSVIKSAGGNVGRLLVVCV